MIVFANANGEAKLVQHTPIIQGSHNVNKITLIGPFPATSAVYVNITLPNGVIVTKFGETDNRLEMDNIDLGDFVKFSAEGQEVNAWSIKLNNSFTQIAGELKISFYVSNNPTDEIIPIREISVPINRGVLRKTNFDIEKTDQETIFNIVNSLNIVSESETNAENSATNAENSATNAENSATNAKNSATNAENSATNAKNSATNAEKWAISEDEPDGDFHGSSMYWAEVAKSAAEKAKNLILQEETNLIAINAAYESKLAAESAQKAYDDIISICGDVNLLLDNILQEQTSLIS